MGETLREASSCATRDDGRESKGAMMKTKNNRLDYISKFNDTSVDCMTEIRMQYEMLDARIRDFLDIMDEKEGSARCAALARTHLETSLMYAIKTLCLLGEE